MRAHAAGGVSSAYLLERDRLVVLKQRKEREQRRAAEPLRDHVQLDSRVCLLKALTVSKRFGELRVLVRSHDDGSEAGGGD